MDKATIDEEIRNLASEQDMGVHPSDEEYVHTDQSVDIGKNQILPDSLGNIGEGRADKYPRQSTEEKIVDELLITVPRAQGYYLKLYKELGPNEMELKLRIDQYEFWGDLEWEVTKLVREHTKKHPRKWGSGKYVIIVWNDKGMRGQKRPPVPIYVDAQESEYDLNKAETVAPTVEEKISEFTQLTKAIGAMNPVVSPTDQAKIMADTFKAGQEAAGSKVAGETSALAAMMTGMFGMMMKVMEAQRPVAPAIDPIMMVLLNKLIGDSGNGKTDVIKMLGELRTAGLIPNPKDQGLESELHKMLALKEVAEAFGGGGGGADESTLSTLIRTLGPKVPEMIGNVTQTVNKVVDFNKKKLDAMGTAAQIKKVPGQPIPVKEVTSPQEAKRKENEEKMKIFLKILTDKLYLYVSNKNYESFDDVSEKLKLLTHGQPILTDAIKQGSMSKDDVIKFVMQYDQEHYIYDNEKMLLDQYVTEYIQYLKEEQIQKPPFIAICTECGVEYNYDTEQDFIQDAKDCDNCKKTNILVPKLPDEHEVDDSGPIQEEQEEPIAASVHAETGTELGMS
jgi:hypothetical protein